MSVNTFSRFFKILFFSEKLVSDFTFFSDVKICFVGIRERHSHEYHVLDGDFYEVDFILLDPYFMVGDPYQRECCYYSTT